MQGERITYTKKALDLLLRAIPTDSYFNVAFFSNTTSWLFPQPVPYNSTNLETAVSECAKINPHGGTEIVRALSVWVLPSSAQCPL